MRTLLLAVPLICGAVLPVRADVRATTEGGRAVLLKDDGTYEYLEPPADVAALDDAEARQQIERYLVMEERTMTGAPCVGPESFTIDGISILERTPDGDMLEVLAEVKVQSHRSFSSASGWDVCFEFAFGRGSVDKGDIRSGRLRLAFSRFGVRMAD